MSKESSRQIIKLTEWRSVDGKTMAETIAEAKAKQPKSFTGKKFINRSNKRRVKKSD